MNPPPQSVLIVAGEASGDMYAAELVADLVGKAVPGSLRFFGCGGARMRESGVETIVDIHRLAVLGPFEALSHLGRLYSALRLLANEARMRQPRLAVLVDFPDFNLRLAPRIKALGIPVFYLISPQVWAWRSGRVKQMRQTIERMLVILPFEKDFYAERGMQVDYIGHPLVDRVRVSRSKSEFFRSHGLDESVTTISLLPGSRTKEIHFHLPVMLQAARWMHWQRPVQFLLPAASRLHRKQISKILDEAGGPPLSLVEDDTYNSVGHSDLAVVASGTATLEAALLGTPLIAVFKISNLTWIVGQYLVRVPFYCLVNLIAGQAIVPELFQNDFTAEGLHGEMAGLLSQPERLKHVRMGLASVKQRLGSGGAIHNAAERILPWLQNSTTL
jgi:lipid-A-disaccharide synthase